MNKCRGEKGNIEFINKGIRGLVTPPKFLTKSNYSEQPSNPPPPQSDASSPPVCYKQDLQSEFPVLTAAFVHYRCVLLSAIPISINCKNGSFFFFFQIASIIVLHACSVV